MSWLTVTLRLSNSHYLVSYSVFRKLHVLQFSGMSTVRSLCLLTVIPSSWFCCDSDKHANELRYRQRTAPVCSSLVMVHDDAGDSDLVPSRSNAAKTSPDNELHLHFPHLSPVDSGHWSVLIEIRHVRPRCFRTCFI